MTSTELEIKDTATTYSFTPAIDGNIIDYTGVEPNKIKLANRKTILTEEYPSYLPQVQIRRKTKYDIPAIKVNDNEFLIKESNELDSKIFKVSLDVYAAVLNYHLEYDRAAASEIQKLNALARTEAKQKEEKKYSYIELNDLPQFPNKFNLNSINNPYNTCLTRIPIAIEKVSLRSPKSGKMSIEAFEFIKDYIKTLSDEDDKKSNIRGNIFKMYGECINEVKQKILDIEYQKLDNESSYTKGVETSYGDSSLNEELLDSHGIRIKRQNGDIINSKEIKEIQYAIDKVHSVYGNLSDTAKEFGLKISHSGKKRMHASKYLGKFIPSYKAIGVSFDNDIKNSSLTAIHEYTHFLDHLQGKEKNAWFASDIQGSIENQIAVKFRNNMNKTKGDYWSRTCECFARAMEEYADIIITKEMHGSITEEHLTFYNNLQGSVPIEKFQTEIEPLVLTLIDDYKKQYAKNPNEQSIEKDQKADIKIHLTNLSKMLESGKSFTVRNDELGDILIDAGETGKGGYGIKHIIEQRYKKDEKKENEITALVPLIIESAIDGKITRDNNYTLETSKDGIVAILRKESDDKSKKWILTGYDDLNKQKEATDAIKTVTANYSYTPEFSRFRKQVGAVIASVTKVSYKDEVLSTSDLKKDDYQKQIYDLAVEKSKKEKQHQELIINQNEIENTVSMLENRLLIITPRLDELRKQVNVQNITDQNFQNSLLNRERSIQELEALEIEERNRYRENLEDLHLDYEEIKAQYKSIEEQGKLIKRELALDEDMLKETDSELVKNTKKLKELEEQKEKIEKELASLDDKGRTLTAELEKLEKEEIDETEKNKFFKASTSFKQLSLFDSSKEVYEGDPALTREHIREAKIARRVYTDNVIKGQKTGLWKSFKDFKKHGVFDIQGAKVATDDKGNITSAGWEQLYQSLSIYRDKRFETFRILFVSQEGEIRDQLAVSNHMPGLVRLNEITDEMIHQMSEYAIETKTRLVLVHNHPSPLCQYRCRPVRRRLYEVQQEFQEFYPEKGFATGKSECLFSGKRSRNRSSYHQQLACES